MPSRRSILVGMTAAALLPRNAFAAEVSAQSLLARAIARAGGARALENARVLAWSGKAIVYTGDKPIHLGVRTEVEPFSYARTDTWILGQTPPDKRSLIVEGDGGHALRNGAPLPLPATLFHHEREQFSLYGLMRLVSLRDPGVSLALLPRTDGRMGLKVAHPSAPPTTLYFDDRGGLIGAENVVDSPDGKTKIPQQIDFSGRIVGAGVRWPRSLRIRQNGAPYFDLTLTSFTPRRVR